MVERRSSPQFSLFEGKKTKTDWFPLLHYQKGGKWPTTILLDNNTEFFEGLALKKGSEK